MPPRSRGCRVCVRRRVKCDGTRPVCVRCQKADLECDGPPEPPPKFQDETEAVTLKFSSGNASAGGDSPGRSSSRSTRSSVFVHPSLFPAPLMPESPATFTEDTYCSFFIANYYNVGFSFADHQDQQRWITYCFESTSQLPLSNLAIRCLFICYFGRATGADTLIHEAKRLYGELLPRLREDLSHSQRSRQFDTVSAIAILIVFEYLVFTSKSGWMNHVKGMRAVFLMLGPDSFQSMPGSAVYSFAKGACLEAAFADQKGCFLGEEGWHLPNPKRDVYSSHLDLLFRICTRFPALMEEVQALERELDHTLAEHTQRVIRSFNAWIGILADLHSWYNSWMVNMEQRPETTSIDRDTAMGASLPFDKVTTYPNAMVASAFCQYYAYTIAGHNWLQKLYWTHVKTTFTYVSLEFDVDASKETIRQNAMRICWSVPSLLSWQGAHVAKFTLLPQLRMAYLALPQASGSARWLEQVLHMLADHDGLQMARHMLGGPGSTGVEGEDEQQGYFLPLSWKDGSEPL